MSGDRASLWWTGSGPPRRARAGSRSTDQPGARDREKQVLDLKRVPDLDKLNPELIPVPEPDPRRPTYRGAQCAAAFGVPADVSRRLPICSIADNASYVCCISDPVARLPLVPNVSCRIRVQGSRGGVGGVSRLSA
jgi:hypothetical protein